MTHINMTDKFSKYLKVAKQIDLIEEEMKRIGYWNNKPEIIPSEPFSFFNSPFELWLQYFLIPTVRQIITEKGDFPKESNLGLRAMKEYDYMDSVPEADNLQRLLREFDNIINK